MTSPRRGRNLRLISGEIIKVDPDCYWCQKDRDIYDPMTVELLNQLVNVHSIEHDSRWYRSEPEDG